MFGLRQKLSLGFIGLLIIMVVIGVESILKLTELGGSIDVILRENYRSVIACQQMKESLERMDSGVLFVLMGYEAEGAQQIDPSIVRFEKAMDAEGGNITLPEEGPVFSELQNAYADYRQVLEAVRASGSPLGERRALYFQRLLPLFQSIKASAHQILQMNQQNMVDANMAAREMAAQARQRMYLLLLAGSCVAVAFMVSVGRWILQPIMKLTSSAKEIGQGNLDLAIGSTSRDEIGQLGREFDSMAAALRRFRRSEQAKLVRLQQATEQALDSLPDAIAIVDIEGRVEAASQTATEDIRLPVGSLVRESPFPWLWDLCDEAIRTGHKIAGKGGFSLIQVVKDGTERYFKASAVPILDELAQPMGVTIVLDDVTLLRQQDELKRNLISTVSHQVKTPLTSIRMALYLLLDEKMGTLTPKQEELLLTAREDSDRLDAIVKDLLDISRIKSGRAQMECAPVSPHEMVASTVDEFRSAAQDLGVYLAVDTPMDLPDVWADITRISHVFANLLSNALKFTPAGGTVTVSSRADDDYVWFSVRDTGQGISSEHLPRVFEQFFRAPKQKQTGAGLGLAIAKEIVEAHGGMIQAESEVGKGSTFTFNLLRADRPRI